MYLAKRSFHVYGVDENGQQVISRTFSRTRLSEFMANLPACTVAMEACGSAHDWARQFREDGHEVRLIAPQFVKPFVKSNKNGNCQRIPPSATELPWFGRVKGVSVEKESDERGPRADRPHAPDSRRGRESGRS
jgi:hypothetical protein